MEGLLLLSISMNGELMDIWLVFFFCPELKKKKNYLNQPLEKFLKLGPYSSMLLFQARVTIQNYYQYRHVDKPGWSIGWAWTQKEIIWSISGAFATVQGDCSAFKHQIPHSCQPKPVIADLTPDASPENTSENCCRGGLLSAWAIDPSNSFSSFEITVGNLDINATLHPPANLTLSAPGPGYTCGPVTDTNPTESLDIGGRRKVQVYSKYTMLELLEQTCRFFLTMQLTISINLLF